MEQKYVNNTLNELARACDECIEWVENVSEPEVKKLARNAYYATYDNEHYYIKFYPALHDTDVYIVSDTSYDKENNGVTDFFKSQNYQYEKLEDNEAYKERGGFAYYENHTDPQRD